MAGLAGRDPQIQRRSDGAFPRAWACASAEIEYALGNLAANKSKRRPTTTTKSPGRGKNTSQTSSRPATRMDRSCRKWPGENLFGNRGNNKIMTGSDVSFSGQLRAT